MKKLLNSEWLHRYKEAKQKFCEKGIFFRVVYGLFITFILAMLVEIFVFNMHFWGNYFKKTAEVVPADSNVTLDSGITKANGVYQIPGGAEYSITFSCIDSKLYDVYVDAINSKNQPVKFKVGVRDCANVENFRFASDRYVISQVMNSRYINLNPSGEVSSVRITFCTDKDNAVTVNKIGFNLKRPFQFAMNRLLIVWLFFAFAYMIAYRKKSYESIYDKKIFWQRSVIYLVMVAQMVFSAWTVNTSYQYPDSQLNDLTQSFMDGKLNVSEDAAKNIAQLDNPYDFQSRVNHINDFFSYWDRSFYNGKMYVYFGIAPILMLYLPAKLLWKVNINSNQVLIITAAALIILAKFFLDQVVNVWFKKKVPFFIYLMCYILLVNVPGLLWNLRKPEFYEIYGMFSYAILLAGLTLWLSSIDDENDEVRVVPLAIGSVFMALLAWCRPNFLLYCLLIIPIFWNQLFKNKVFLKEKRKLFVIAVPFVVIGIITMIYNYCRFDSILEFGSKYQLTVSDMHYTGQLAKLPYGLWWYYLAIPVININFPFFFGPSNVSSYQGYNFFGNNCMGTIFINVVLLFIFALPKVRDWMKKQKKGMYGFCVMGIVLAFVQSCLVIITGGIHQRYTTDFLVLYIIVAILIIFALMVKNYKEKLYSMLCKLLIASFAFTMFFQISTSMRGEIDFLRSNHPEIYYQIERSAQFWL